MSKRTNTYRPRRKVRHSVANPFMAPPKAEVRREIEALAGPQSASSQTRIAHGERLGGYVEEGYEWFAKRIGRGA